MSTHISGGCLCRAVRYTSTEAPIAARICWCRLCQYIAAGSATVNVVFPSQAVTIQGSLTDYRSIADSGTIMHRRFCAACGTPIYSQAESRPHLIFIRAGTLDDSTIAKPSAVIWTSKAPPWALFAPEMPCHEAQPPPAS